MYLITLFLKLHRYWADKDWWGGTCLAMKGRSSFDGMVGFIWRSEITSFIELRFNTDVPDRERANRKPFVLRGHEWWRFTVVSFTLYNILGFPYFFPTRNWVSYGERTVVGTWFSGFTSFAWVVMWFVFIWLSVVTYNGVVSVSYVDRPLRTQNLEGLLKLVWTGKKSPGCTKWFEVVFELDKITRIVVDGVNVICCGKKKL